MGFKLFILLSSAFVWVVCVMLLIKQLWAMVHEKGVWPFLRRAFNVTSCLMLVMFSNVALGAVMNNVFGPRYEYSHYESDASMQCAKQAKPDSAPWRLLFPLSL